MTTLKQFDTGRDNNFDLLRIIAATLVIFSHSFLVTNSFKNEPLIKLCGFLDFGALGVKIFFTISGYLIMKSLYNRHFIGRFIWARFLRIFPGLFVNALFCALIVGPICTIMPLYQYFANSSLYDFIWRLSTLHNFTDTLPGTFLSNPFPKGVNNPIWTLPAELLMYVFVILWGILLLIWKKQFKNLLTTISSIIVLIIFYWGISFTSSYMGYVLSWGILFLLGALCYLFSNYIVISIPLFFVMLLVFYLLFHFKLPFFEYAFDILLVYGVLIFSYHRKLQIRSFRRVGDFSFGLYIYAFPIQQLLILKFASLSASGLFIIAFVLTIILAALSWYLIEKPLLSLKKINFVSAK